MNNKDKINLFSELREQIENSIGMKITLHNRRLIITYQIFLGNYNELKQALELLLNQEFALNIWAEENNDKLEQYQMNIVRLLHNFLAAAMTLKDHAGIFIKSINWDTQLDTQFEAEYQEKVKQEFNNSGISRFMQKLRNFTLHVGIPTTVTQLRFSNKEELEYSIILDINKIKTWSGWEGVSKQYISQLKDETKLEDLVNEYAHKIIDFYTWFGTRQNEIYQAHLKELEEMQNKIKIVLEEIMPSTDNEIK